MQITLLHEEARKVRRRNALTRRISAGPRRRDILGTDRATTREIVATSRR